MTMKRQLTTLTLFCALGASAQAGTFTIDPTPGAADFVGLTEALGSGLLDDGDTLLVAPGTYFGSYVIDLELRLIATGGPSVTTLNASGAATVLTIDAPALVRGFTITGGGGPGSAGGILVTSTERATIEQNVIHDNHPLGDGGIPAGGILVDAYAAALVRDNSIHSNTSLSVGGVFGGPFATLDLVRNRIMGNGGAGTINGGVLFGASGRILCNQITGNHGSAVGGLSIPGGMGPTPFGSTVDVINNTIYGNVGSAPIGSVGGVYLDDGGMVTMAGCSVFANFGATSSGIMASADFTTLPVPGSLTMSFSHLDVPPVGLPPGTAMLPMGAPPGFVAPAAATLAGPTTAGDFELLPTSIYVDAGLDAAYPAGFAPGDLSGGWRFLGAAVDVGAEELGEGCVPPLPVGIGKVCSAGTRTTLTSSGEPSVSSGTFSMTVTGAVPGKPGLLFYGPGEDWRPLGEHWLYVAGPIQRLDVQTLDGAGSTTYDPLPEPVAAGTTRMYQYWSRDPDHADGSGVTLSNGILVTFCE